MVAPGIRDPDEVQVIRSLRADLKELAATVVGRWGRVPYVAADPASTPDGSVWIRSDDRGLRYRAASATATLPLGALGTHTLTTVFTTTGTHTTLQDEGLTLTINDTAGRRLRFTFVVQPYAPGGANSIVLTLLRNGVKVRDYVLPSTAVSTTDAHAMTLSHVETIAATFANSVYKLQIAASPTNTSVSSFGSATLPRQFIIEDIGT